MAISTTWEPRGLEMFIHYLVTLGVLFITLLFCLFTALYERIRHRQSHFDKLPRQRSRTLVSRGSFFSSEKYFNFDKERDDRTTFEKLCCEYHKGESFLAHCLCCWKKSSGEDAEGDDQDQKKNQDLRFGAIRFLLRPFFLLAEWIAFAFILRIFYLDQDRIFHSPSEYDDEHYISDVANPKIYFNLSLSWIIAYQIGSAILTLAMDSTHMSRGMKNAFSQLIGIRGLVQMRSEVLNDASSLQMLEHATIQALFLSLPMMLVTSVYAFEAFRGQSQGRWYYMFYVEVVLSSINLARAINYKDSFGMTHYTLFQNIMLISLRFGEIFVRFHILAMFAAYFNETVLYVYLIFILSFIFIENARRSAIFRCRENDEQKGDTTDKDKETKPNVDEVAVLKAKAPSNLWRKVVEVILDTIFKYFFIDPANLTLLPEKNNGIGWYTNFYRIIESLIMLGTIWYKNNYPFDVFRKPHSDLDFERFLLLRIGPGVFFFLFGFFFLIYSGNFSVEKYKAYVDKNIGKMINMGNCNKEIITLIERKELEDLRTEHAKIIFHQNPNLMDKLICLGFTTGELIRLRVPWVYLGKEIEWGKIKEKSKEKLLEKVKWNSEDSNYLPPLVVDEKQNVSAHEPNASQDDGVSPPNLLKAKSVTFAIQKNQKKDYRPDYPLKLLENANPNSIAGYTKFEASTGEDCFIKLHFEDEKKECFIKMVNRIIREVNLQRRDNDSDKIEPYKLREDESSSERQLDNRILRNVREYLLKHEILVYIWYMSHVKQGSYKTKNIINYKGDGPLELFDLELKLDLVMETKVDMQEYKSNTDKTTAFSTAEKSKTAMIFHVMTKPETKPARASNEIDFLRDYASGLYIYQDMRKLKAGGRRNLEFDSTQKHEIDKIKKELRELLSMSTEELKTFDDDMGKRDTKLKLFFEEHHRETAPDNSRNRFCEYMEQFYCCRCGAEDVVIEFKHDYGIEFKSGRVSKVDPDSTAASDGIKVGWKILEIKHKEANEGESPKFGDGVTLRKPSALEECWRSPASGAQVVQVEYDGNYYEATITADHGDGTYDVTYTDTAFGSEEGVLKSRIQGLSEAANDPTERSAGEKKKEDSNPETTCFARFWKWLEPRAGPNYFIKGEEVIINIPIAKKEILFEDLDPFARIKGTLKNIVPIDDPQKFFDEPKAEAQFWRVEIDKESYIDGNQKGEKLIPEDWLEKPARGETRDRRFKRKTLQAMTFDFYDFRILDDGGASKEKGDDYTNWKVVELTTMGQSSRPPMSVTKLEDQPDILTWLRHSPITLTGIFDKLGIEVKTKTGEIVKVGKNSEAHKNLVKEGMAIRKIKEDNVWKEFDPKTLENAKNKETDIEIQVGYYGDAECSVKLTLPESTFWKRFRERIPYWCCLCTPCAHLSFHPWCGRGGSQYTAKEILTGEDPKRGYLVDDGDIFLTSYAEPGYLSLVQGGQWAHCGLVWRYRAKFHDFLPKRFQEQLDVWKQRGIVEECTPLIFEMTNHHREPDTSHASYQPHPTKVHLTHLQGWHFFNDALTYDGPLLGFRKYIGKKDLWFYKALFTTMHLHHMKPYEAVPFEFICSGLCCFPTTPRKKQLEEIFCSELVGEFHFQIGQCGKGSKDETHTLLPEYTYPSEFQPSDYGARKTCLPFGFCCCLRLAYCCGDARSTTLYPNLKEKLGPLYIVDNPSILEWKREYEADLILKKHGKRDSTMSERDEHHQVTDELVTAKSPKSRELYEKIRRGRLKEYHALHGHSFGYFLVELTWAIFYLSTWFSGIYIRFNYLKETRDNRQQDTAASDTKQLEAEKHPHDSENAADKQSSTKPPETQKKDSPKKDDSIAIWTRQGWILLFGSLSCGIWMTIFRRTMKDELRLYEILLYFYFLGIIFVGFEGVEMYWDCCKKGPAFYRVFYTTVFRLYGIQLRQDSGRSEPDSCISERLSPVKIPFITTVALSLGCVITLTMDFWGYMAKDKGFTDTEIPDWFIFFGCFGGLLVVVYLLGKVTMRAAILQEPNLADSLISSSIFEKRVLENELRDYHKFWERSLKEQKENESKGSQQHHGLEFPLSETDLRELEKELREDIELSQKHRKKLESVKEESSEETNAISIILDIKEEELMRKEKRLQKQLERCQTRIHCHEMEKLKAPHLSPRKSKRAPWFNQQQQSAFDVADNIASAKSAMG